MTNAIDACPKPCRARAASPRACAGAARGHRSPFASPGESAGRAHLRAAARPRPERQTVAAAHAKIGRLHDAATPRPITQTMHVNPGGDPRLHRLPRRRRERREAGRARSRSDADVPRGASTQAHVLPRYPERVELPVERQSAATATRCSTAKRPSSSASSIPGDYRVAREACGACHLRDHPGGRAQPDVDHRDVLGRRVVQQRHPAVQALHPRRGVHRARASPRRSSIRSRRRRSMTRRRASCRSSIRCRAWETVPPGRHLPRVRARRPRDRHASSRRSACRTTPARCRSSTSRAGPTSASRTAARAPGAASRCRCSTSPRRASTIRTCGSSAPTTSPATTARRAAPAATSSTPTTAIRSTPGRTRSSATRARRRRADPTIPKDESGPSAAARVHARDPDRRSAWSATCTSRTCS